MLMKKMFLCFSAAILLASCKKDSEPNETIINENASSFKQVASITIAGTGAAEITAYCEKTKRLFVVNNSASLNRIEVVDIKNPEAPFIIGNINLTIYQ